MRKIDTILKLCENSFNEEQIKTLKNILEAVLEPSHNVRGNDDLILKFIEHCQMKNLSDGTIDEYRRKLNMLSGNSEVSFLEMTNEDIEAFIFKAKKMNCQPRTLNTYIACYRTFFKWLTNYDYITKDPMLKVINVKEEYKVKVGFTRKEIEKMRNYFTHPRDRAIFEFFLGSGVRISELCKLQIKDLDLTNMPVSVVIHGKGNKQRRIPISDTAFVYLGDYLNTRKELTPEDPVFASRRGTVRFIKTDTIKDCFYRASKELDIHIHAHKFRRTYCSELVSHGMALAYAQKLMGHSSPATTMGYTNVKENLVFAEFQKVSNF